MKLYLTMLCLFCIIMFSLLACNINKNNQSMGKSFDQELLNADHFLTEPQRAEVMLLGTLHFSYPNQDTYKTAEEDMVDFTSEKKQKEILEVVDRLQKFKPTIICIEAHNQSIIDSLYDQYLLGKHQLEIGEDEQLGFRLGKRLGLKKIYATDTYSWLRENWDEVPLMHGFWEAIYKLDTMEVNNWYKKYDEYDLYTVELEKTHKVDDVLKYYNHPENLNSFISPYMVQMKTSNHNGPDAFALKYYDRNLRIFNNILKTNPKQTDRVLVIYGASHVAILQTLFEISPYFKLTRPYEY